MFKVTNKWLNSNRTPRGGWTDTQWLALGVTSTMRKTKGWKSEILGMEITETQKENFEKARVSLKPVKAKHMKPRANKKQPKYYHHEDAIIEIISGILDDVDIDASLCDAIVNELKLRLSESTAKQ